MIQGCTSDAGKSTLVAAICRVLYRRQISVAPFKPQNMALNSAVTIEGGEIGRAQAVQAMAAGLLPQNHMNPILLKPNSDTGAQVIIQGHALTNMEAQDYHAFKKDAMKYVLDSYQQLQNQYINIIIEGAGSPAEINLRENDIANMGFAEAINCPVILIADIDRGGVFAHIVGTLDLLSASEKQRVKGFVINRFRGDIALLQSGIDWLEYYTGLPVLAVLPYLHNLNIAAEDAINTQQNSDKKAINIVIPVLPHISNHTDFDILRLHPQINLTYIAINDELPNADLIILPGSKSVINDLTELQKNNWDKKLNKHLRYGGKLMGICGGFQMLGSFIHDPKGIEGKPASITGFNFLNMETILHEHKQLKNVEGTLILGGAHVKGYEIHCGISVGDALHSPAATLNSGNDGAISDDNHILGTYIHGLFDHPDSLAALLDWAGLEHAERLDYEQQQQHAINRLADTLEQHMNIEQFIQQYQL